MYWPGEPKTSAEDPRSIGPTPPPSLGQRNIERLVRITVLLTFRPRIPTGFSPSAPPKLKSKFAASYTGFCPRQGRMRDPHAQPEPISKSVNGRFGLVA